MENGEVHNEVAKVCDIFNNFFINVTYDICPNYYIEQD